MNEHAISPSRKQWQTKARFDLNVQSLKRKMHSTIKSQNLTQSSPYVDETKCKKRYHSRANPQPKPFPQQHQRHQQQRRGVPNTLPNAIRHKSLYPNPALCIVKRQRRSTRALHLVRVLDIAELILLLTAPLHLISDELLVLLK
ncbi:hypothetical protein PMIN05_002704 [Paraphaeosphaeria minitans]